MCDIMFTNLPVFFPSWCQPLKDTSICGFEFHWITALFLFFFWVMLDVSLLCCSSVFVNVSCKVTLCEAPSLLQSGQILLVWRAYAFWIITFNFNLFISCVNETHSVCYFMSFFNDINIFKSFIWNPYWSK